MKKLFNRLEPAVATSQDTDFSRAAIFLPEVESFLDLDIAKIRARSIDQAIVDQQLIVLTDILGAPEAPDFHNRLVAVLAGIKAEMHYLRAAFLEGARYKDPAFDLNMPLLPEKLRLDGLEIDMRTEITGGNWWRPESDGRWAGPENESSLLIPALGFGRYVVAINIVDEIDAGIIDEMGFTFNRQAVELNRESHGLPVSLTAEIEISDEYRFPFWSLKFSFPRLASPAQFGSPDQRMLAIRVKSVRLTRVDP